MQKIIIRLFSALTKEIKIGFKRLAVIGVIGLIGFSNYGYGAGADVNTRDNSGSTPLIAAVINGHYDVAKVLIEYKADVNIPNNKGATALHYASFLGYSNIAKLLIDAGADVNAKDNDGWTPLKYAMSFMDFHAQADGKLNNDNPSHVKFLKIISIIKSRMAERPADKGTPDEYRNSSDE